MEEKKRVLLVTDDEESTKQAALMVFSVLETRDDVEPVMVSAESFSATDLLPACAFFLGCESPHPHTFAYLEDVLLHINLAGRPCGFFSVRRKALRYLSALLRDSEACRVHPLLVKNASIQTITIRRAIFEKWVNKVMRTGGLAWTS